MGSRTISKVLQRSWWNWSHNLENIDGLSELKTKWKKNFLEGRERNWSFNQNTQKWKLKYARRKITYLLNFTKMGQILTGNIRFHINNHCHYFLPGQLILDESSGDSYHSFFSEFVIHLRWKYNRQRWKYIKPRLSRSCRHMYLWGRGYESVAECVLLWICCSWIKKRTPLLCPF